MDTLDNSVKVFVYGTLKPGESNYQYYCADVVKATRAIAFGQLFALSLGYPAMTVGNRSVQGFLLSFSNKVILERLDLLEGYNPNGLTEQNEYHRQQIETYNLALSSLGLAWVYLMTPEQINYYGGFLIPSGWWSG